MSNFVVIDFETANEHMSSICQVGIVRFENNEPVETYSSLVNPEDYFSGMNISIHGINEDAVQDAPTFPEIYRDVTNFLGEHIVLSHGWFDLHCIKRVTEKYDLDPIENQWLDTTKIVRRVLPEFSQRGYGLQNLAHFFQLKTKAHDALDDAYTCAVIVKKLLDQTSTEIEDWFELVKRPLSFGSTSVIDPKDLEANPNGEYYGQTIVFTGALSLPRKEAQKLAASVGFAIQDGVRKDTTCLVTGTQNPVSLRGHEKSSKQIKVEKMIADGLKINIFSEDDFMRICKSKN